MDSFCAGIYQKPCLDSQDYSEFVSEKNTIGENDREVHEYRDIYFEIVHVGKSSNTEKFGNMTNCQKQICFISQDNNHICESVDTFLKPEHKLHLIPKLIRDFTNKNDPLIFYFDIKSKKIKEIIDYYKNGKTKYVEISHDTRKNYNKYDPFPLQLYYLKYGEVEEFKTFHNMHNPLGSTISSDPIIRNDYTSRIKNIRDQQAEFFNNRFYLDASVNRGSLLKKDRYIIDIIFDKRNKYNYYLENFLGMCPTFHNWLPDDCVSHIFKITSNIKYYNCYSKVNRLNTDCDKFVNLSKKEILEVLSLVCKKWKNIISKMDI